MTLHGFLLIGVLLFLLALTIRPLGGYMAWIFKGQHASIWFLRVFERVLFRLAGVNPANEQN